MAYLAERIRAAITETHAVTEQKMFGGLSFLIGGNMAVAASGQGGLLVRVPPEESDHLLATTESEEMVMRGRPMIGCLRVAARDVRTEQQLREWVARGADYAASLPEKASKKR